MAKKKVAKKDVVAVAETEVETVKLTAEQLAKYAPEDESFSDIVFPRLVAMNPTSSKVMDGTATFGQMVDLAEGRVVAEADEPLKVVPVTIIKTYMVSKMVGGKFEFHSIDAWDGNRDWEETNSEGEVMKNELCYNLYCLLEGDVDLPYIITFKGMSAKSGRALWTLMYRRNTMQGLPPFGRIVEITPKKSKNDKGNFVILEIKGSDKLKGPVLTIADKWFSTLRSMKPIMTAHESESEPVSTNSSIQGC